MFRANIYGPLDRGMVILQHCCCKFSHKETLQQTFVMQYDITLTYSMFTSPIACLRRSNIAFYGIKRLVHIALSV